MNQKRVYKNYPLAFKEEGFAIGRYRTKTVIQKWGLRVTQHLADKVTTKRKKQ